MGSLGLLLVPAFGGYLFVARFNATRDRLKREHGYHVVFRAGVAGVVLFGAGRVIVICVDYLCPGLGPLWKAAFPMDYSGTATLALIVGWSLPYLLNPFVNRLEARRRSAVQSGDHIGVVVDQALTKRHPVQISLTGRKAYIGLPLARTFHARDDGGDLVLVPFWSGYRDRETQELKRTTNYVPVIRRHLKKAKKSLADFRIAIPMAEIQSVRPFDSVTYHDFQQRHVEPRRVRQTS